MRKIIAIGESVLDIVFKDGQPQRSMVGGRIANAAAIAATAGVPCTMVSECGADRVGDLVVDYLSRHGVDVSAIDRYTEGSTALSAIFDDGRTLVNYGIYPRDRFNVVWPRIDEDDIVIFGSLYAIDAPQRERLFELVNHAVQRKAILVYLPGFQHGISYRITHVMPAILENLEISHLVIAHDRDLHDIFPGETATQAFNNHVDFYCNNYLHIHSGWDVTRFARHGVVQHVPAAGETTTNALGWQAGFTAGVACSLIQQGVTHDSIDTLGDDVWRSIIATAQLMASYCAAGDNCLTPMQARQFAASETPD